MSANQSLQQEVAELKAELEETRLQLSVAESLFKEKQVEAKNWSERALIAERYLNRLNMGLTQTKLAERFELNQATLSRQLKKGKEAFLDWSKSKDPKGVSWEYDQTTQLFHQVP